MKKRYLTIGFLLAPLVVWLTCEVLARPISVRIAQRWGLKIVHAGDGKFSDAAIFLQHRFIEGAWLVTLLTGLAVLSIALGALLARRFQGLWKWVPFSAAGFIGVNAWLKFAVATPLFWCLFWNGKGTTDNLTQFHIKLLLMDENRAPTKVVLAGSSQVRTQIDARLLNAQFGSNFFTTELHFPGNRTFDDLFLNRELEGHKADIMVCYLSEANFYVGGVSEGFSLFLTFRDLPEFFRMGGKLGWSDKSLGYALLGNMLPLFWLREPITERVMGEQLTRLRQRQLESGLGPDLHQRAMAAAPTYRLDDQSAFCFEAFEEFVIQCRTQQRRVVVCCGQVNPILARVLDPALRPRMLSFLRGLAAKYPNVVLLDEGDLPAQTEADYEDLVHATTAARIRFTEALAPKLQSLSLN
jgi:hypothetical protein